MGIEIDGETCLFTLQFADDQVIYGKEDWECMARKQKWGLYINKEKYSISGIGKVSQILHWTPMKL